jgi:hypothetical protein
VSGVNTCFANPGTSVVRVEVKSDQLVIELANSKGANPKRKRSRNAETLSKLVASIARGWLDSIKDRFGHRNRPT